MLIFVSDFIQLANAILQILRTSVYLNTVL